MYELWDMYELCTNYATALRGDVGFLATKHKLNSIFERIFLSEIRPTLTPPCGRGGYCPSNAVRIVLAKESVLHREGFRCVRILPCPSSETRIVLT